MSLIIQNISEVRSSVAKWKSEGLRVGVVPTMGALHRGHESLIKRASHQCDKVIVSIFVNPTQFGPNEDFESYPRTLEADKKICDQNNVAIIFAPSSKEMYPELSKGNLTKVVPPSEFQNKLCGSSRIGHFDGVATVVLKLLNITQADTAFFGEKDAQQLMIIKKMVADLNIPTEIINCPLIRDEDGLATSSRNTHLSTTDREKVLCLHKILFKIKELFIKGETCSHITKQKALKLLDKDVKLEYLDFYSQNFEETKELKESTLVAIAAKVGNVRLIDNIVL